MNILSLKIANEREVKLIRQAIKQMIMEKSALTMFIIQSTRIMFYRV